MKEEVRKQIYDMLETFREALDYLAKISKSENSLSGGTLIETVAFTRAYITNALEEDMRVSLENRIRISKLSDEDWLRTAYRIMGELENPFRIQNAYDAEFQKLLDYVWTHTEPDLVRTMQKNLQSMKNNSVQTWNGFVEYFARFPLWGTFQPQKGDFTTFELRAQVLKRHSYDFLWLYRRLEDYLSKRTLTAILRNWAFLDTACPRIIKSIFPDYWEPDIFPDNRDEILVDVGAYVGDSIQRYVNFYGRGYRKIYAYEIARDSYEALRKNIQDMGLPNVEARRKGAGREHTTMFIHTNSADASANQVQTDGNGEEVEIVRLDEDIEDPVTMIKMDIEGAEQDALWGCSRMIEKYHPKLAICTYHGYEDIWKIPVLIDSMYSGYRFYMRHNGGNLIPTEFVLLCSPPPSV